MLSPFRGLAEAHLEMPDPAREGSWTSFSGTSSRDSHPVVLQRRDQIGKNFGDEALSTVSEFLLPEEMPVLQATTLLSAFTFPHRSLLLHFLSYLRILLC